MLSYLITTPGCSQWLLASVLFVGAPALWRVQRGAAAAVRDGNGPNGAVLQVL